jgi:hypothetical protein
MIRIVYLVLFLLISCGSDPLEKEINTALQEKDFLKTAALCAGYKGERFKESCLEAKTIAEEEIVDIIRNKQDSPFMKIIINPEKDQKIRELLKKDIYLGIKYRTIWNEVSEKR